MKEKRTTTVEQRKAKKRFQRKIQRMIQFFIGIIVIVVLGVIIATVMGTFSNKSLSENEGNVANQGGNKVDSNNPDEETTPEETEPPTKLDGTVIQFSPVEFDGEVTSGHQDNGENSGNNTENGEGGQENNESGGSTETSGEIKDLYEADVFPANFLKDMSAKYVFAVDCETKQTLLQKNAYEHTDPASTTKIVTALTAMEYLSYSDVITIGDEIDLIDSASSVAYLKKGQQITFENMLYALMLPSGNDAAYSVAVAAARKSAGDESLSINDAVSKFVDLMNENVEYMGLENTHFTTPDGMTADGQYTCAADMARIAWWALDNKRLMEISSSHKKRVVFVTGEDVTYESTNMLMDPESEYYVPYVTGLKTGSTSNAGKCLVSTASLNGRNVICVVMNDTEQGRWMNTKEIFEYVNEGSAQ